MVLQAKKKVCKIYFKERIYTVFINVFFFQLSTVVIKKELPQFALRNNLIKI